MSILGIIGKELKVAGHYYKVIYDDESLNKEEILGQCNFITHIMRICKWFQPNKKEKRQLRSKTDTERTVYHEILHAVDGMYNNYGLTEKEVARLSVGLHQVMKDNFIIKVRNKKGE